MKSHRFHVFFPAFSTTALPTLALAPSALPCDDAPGVQRGGRCVRGLWRCSSRTWSWWGSGDGARLKWRSTKKSCAMTQKIVFFSWVLCGLMGKYWDHREHLTTGSYQIMGGSGFIFPANPLKIRISLSVGFTFFSTNKHGDDLENVCIICLPPPCGQVCRETSIHVYIYISIYLSIYLSACACTFIYLLVYLLISKHLLSSYN